MSATRQAFSPGLLLSYDSGSGNSPFGLGWRVDIPAIVRKTEQGLPQYRDATDSDTFLLSGADDLTPMLKEVAGSWQAVEEPRTENGTDYRIRRYRPRTEGGFSKIERWQRLSDGDLHWRVTTADNVRRVYGLTDASRIADPDDPTRVFQWLVDYSYDDRGNCIRYSYKPEDLEGVDPSLLHEKNHVSGTAPFANRYLKRVRYGNHTPYEPGAPLPEDFFFETVFDYGEHDETPRPDDEEPWTVRHDPFSTYRAGFEIRTYRFCRRVLLFHHFESLGDEPCLVRALHLTYEDTPSFKFLTSLTQTGYQRQDDGSYTSKSLPPLSLSYEPLVWDTEVHTVDAAEVGLVPTRNDGQRHRWIDLYGEGLVGLLSEHEPGWFYKRNEGDGHLSPPDLVAPKPSVSGLANDSVTIADIEGNGRQAAVQYDGVPQGFFRIVDDEEWATFRPFDRMPSRSTRHPQARWIDLDGDGRADLMVDEDDVFLWYPSEGDEGFDAPQTVRKPFDEEQGPTVVFADATQSIFLADLSGDGLTDIVRIRNGEVHYWPNTGYGTFGVKVSMTNAPHFDHPDRFDPQLLQLADVDGSGLTDLLYVGPEGVRIWKNLSGNAWSQAPISVLLPPVVEAADVQVFDLLGTGTACAVWTSPLPDATNAPLRYVDLTGGRKPHLLVSYENNTGKTVLLHYRSSTHFYLEDRAAGRPWVTKLPFPVHCLSRVETRDQVRGSYFTSQYTYHHGYYDHEDREFRGFGRVDQFDTEVFDHFAVSGATNVVDEPLHQPPVLTKTWFHTGAALEREDLFARLKEEYYDNPAVAEHRVAPPVRPEDLTATELREAARATRGLLLRQETYALDESSEASVPYAVSENGYDLQRLQPRSNGHPASFLVSARETLTYQYERNPADPRINHSLVLETNDLGQVVRAAAINYPRRSPDPALPAEVQSEQARRVVTYSETDFTNDVDTPVAYRLRVPCERRDYEITGAVPADGSIFTREELDGQIASATAIAFEAPPSGGLEKRLVGHARLYSLADDLSGPLPLGTQESLGLRHRTHQLAFTPGLLSTLYDGQVSDALLTEAGYVHSEGDANWWVPSGTTVYPADAQAHFYLPTGSRDSFGTVLATVQYDAFDLLATATEDALGNRVEALQDYRVLGPSQVTDANGSRTAVERDELGHMVARAVLGREDESEGDTLADPTTRVEYNLDNWRLHGVPNFVRTFAREQHGPSNPRWQESVTYSDGHGAVIMTKVQAEPGIARRFDPVIGTVVEEDTSPEVRWVGTGRTILDNKGNAVKQYEPYFSTTDAFEDEATLVETGVTPLLFYDPLGRLLRTERPDGTFATVAVDPWSVTQSDVNDTVLESEWYADRGHPDPAGPEPTPPDERAAWLAARHAETPALIHTDILGRPVYVVADNGAQGTRATRRETDLTGHVSRAFDARDREVAMGRTNLIGAPCYARSAEKGERWLLANVLGNLVRFWDDANRTVRPTYDSLHRPLSTHLQPPSGPEVVLSLNVYGEAHPNADALRLRGRLFQFYDTAGVITIDGYDFKGIPNRIERQFASEYRTEVDWSGLVGQAIEDLDALASPLLDANTYDGTTTVDALNRPIESRLPDGTRLRPTYNEANILETLALQPRGRGSWRTVLENQDYDAKGQRLRAEFGNQTVTRYTYDPRTYRLTRLSTHRIGDGAVLQDLRYHYDPVGNITEHSDDAQQTYFFDNSVVRPEHRYTYDALYQLVTATGREHAGGQPTASDSLLHSLPHPNDPGAVRTYTEHYDYDELGNLQALRHVATGGSWTRHYHYAHEDDPSDATNRLLATSQPGDDATGPYSASYTYDGRGNMASMPHLVSLEWNALDQLQEVDLEGGGTAYYVYNGSGQRVRKVIERPGGQVQERIYVGGVEFYREYRADHLELERQTVHVSDDTGRIAQIDTKTVDTDDPSGLGVPVMRYVYGNHLGSATLETDESGALVSYEEYHPFGSTSYQSGRSVAEVSLKRYRYIGKERDDETGLYYCGARYYAAWLGRWTSPDPAGFVDGFNLWAYSRNNPVVIRDPSGTNGESVILNRSSLPSEVLEAFKTNTPAARGTLEQHFRGHTYQREGTTYQFVPGSFAWESSESRNLGVWNALPESSATAGEDQAGPAPGAGDGDGGDGAAQTSPEPAPEATPTEDDPETGSLGTGGAAASQAAPGAERFIWNYDFPNQGLPGSQRGFILQNMYTNDFRRLFDPRVSLRDSTPRYDYEPPGQNRVQQIKSTKSANPGQVTRDATHAADEAITRNPTGTMTGKRPQAVVITQTDASASYGSSIDDALSSGRKPFTNNPLPPERVRGLPGALGSAGRAMSGIGFGLSAFSLGSSVARGDVPMAAADTLGTVGGGLELYAIAKPGAAVAGVSAMTAGLVVGGLGIAVASGVSGYRALQAGDTAGAIAGAVGVGAGTAIAAGALMTAASIAAGPVVLAAGLIAAVGVGIFHAGRYFDWW